MKISDIKKVEDLVFNTHDHYLGRILTILDASITGVQGKAIKDLVKREMYDYAQDILGNTQTVLYQKRTEDGEPLKIVINQIDKSSL